MSSRVVFVLALGVLAMTPSIGWAAPLGPGARETSATTGISGGPPRVVATVPADGATSVAVSTNLTVRFDAPMNATSVEAALEITPATAGDFAWNTTRTLVRFDPHLYLRYGTQYEVRLIGSLTRDANGQPLDGNGDGVGGDDYVFRFITEPDVTPPRVLAVAPAANSANASVTAEVEIVFSEPMDRASVEDAFSYTNRSFVWNASAGTFSWEGRTFPDDTAIFNPFENFPFAAYINTTMRASAQDSAGRGLDGNGNGRSEGSPRDDVVWTFATEASDTTPPRVVAIDPGNGTTGVPETSTVTLTFSETMDRTSVSDAFALHDPVRNWTEADGLFSWSRGADVVTYTPAGILSFDVEYRVSLGLAAADVNGNAVGVPFASSFRTRPQPDATPPRVVSTIPKDGDAEVGREPTVSITFDDGMDTAKTQDAISLVGGAEPPWNTIPVAEFQWDGANHTVSFRSVPALDWDSPYRVRVSQSARDDAGLALPASYEFAFRTVPWSGRVLGRVVEGEASLSGASVTLGNQTTQTTENGTFVFPRVIAGLYDLMITKPGYVTKHLTLALDQRSAFPDAVTIDLGVIPLQREEAGSPIFLAGGLVGVAALGAFALYLRGRRPPTDAPEDLGEWHDDLGEAEP